MHFLLVRRRPRAFGRRVFVWILSLLNPQKLSNARPQLQAALKVPWWKYFRLLEVELRATHTTI